MASREKKSGFKPSRNVPENLLLPFDARSDGYCASPPSLLLPGFHAREELPARLAGDPINSAKSCWGCWQERRELCMMWASNISNNRSYKGTMFFIFMECRWSMPLLLRTFLKRKTGALGYAQQSILGKTQELLP